MRDTEAAALAGGWTRSTAGVQAGLAAPQSSGATADGATDDETSVLCLCARDGNSSSGRSLRWRFQSNATRANLCRRERSGPPVMQSSARVTQVRLAICLLALSTGLWAQTPQPTAAQLSAQDLLKTARAALSGGEAKAIDSLSVWGAYRRGGQASMMTLSLDLAGRFLEEHTVYSTGGEVQRMGRTEDGVGAVGGGMPGDEGGPALNASVTEGWNGKDYWIKNGAGGTATGGSEARKMTFRRIFVRYALAFTLTPPKDFPMVFAYAGRVESPNGMVDALEGKGPDDFLVHLFLDIKTHLPLMLQYISTVQGVQEVQMWFQDYKAEDGLVTPHTVIWFANGKLSEEFQVQRLKVNPKFKPEKFQR